MALCITHAEPELTARPWFRVLNSHQGQSAYSGLVAELVIYVVAELPQVVLSSAICP